jgi:hypothetical protein
MLNCVLRPSKGLLFVHDDGRGRSDRSTRGLRLPPLSMFVVLFFMLSSAWAHAVVVPTVNTNVEGDSNNVFPYSLTPAGLTAQRYQQIYAASEFGGRSGLITQIRYRADAFTGSAFSATLPNVQIILSVTSKTPATLSAIYASNFGPNQTTVYTGALTLSSFFTGPGVGPKGFDIVINLQTPFFYNPAAGNLLMEVKNFVGVTITQFDAVTSTAVVNRVSNVDNDPNATSGIVYFGSGGFVTQFIFFTNQQYQIKYAANLNIGDSFIDITNTGDSATTVLTNQNPAQNNINGSICVNVYTFAADEQEVACCSCLVTPNALWSASVKTALLNSTLTPSFPNEVVVKLISTIPLTGAGGAQTCNPASLTNASVTSGLLAWGTTVHGSPTATGPTFQMAETPFLAATLSAAELQRDVQECQFIQILGSGQSGMCKGCQNVGLGAAAQ